MLLPYHTKGILEAGCDEAGRGCLAGPVVAAAVILPKGFSNELLNDSKQLTHNQREQLRPVIEKEALCWAVGFVSPTEIDEINILNASFLAMHRALDQLKKLPKHILVDGNRFKAYNTIRHSCIIKGDGIYQSIAAASVLAKTHRDEYMSAAHHEVPHYNWKSNKGYPTVAHRTAISLHGTHPEHRISFRLLPEQLEINFSLSTEDSEI
ncbi:MAG: ribonuclease HII [Bacteroidota bacterium]